MRARMRTLSFLAALFVVTSCAPAGATPAPASRAPTYDSAFWQAWGDGQAELAGYTL